MSVLAAARDLLVPPRCAGCAAPGEWLCLECRDACDRATLRSAGLPIVGAGIFGGGLREAIHRLKYAAERGLARELGALVARTIAADLASGVALDVIVPVALHPARRAARGYDQAELIAREAAGALGLPVRSAVHRIRAGRPQVELDRSARADNVRGAFVAEARSLRGLRVALVDDVATTGATLRAAAATARAAGARGVRAYVVAVDD